MVATLSNERNRMTVATAWNKRGAAWVTVVEEDAEVPEEIVLPDDVKLTASSGDEDWVGYGFEDPSGHRWLLSTLSDAGNGYEWIVEPAQDAVSK